MTTKTSAGEPESADLGGRTRRGMDTDRMIREGLARTASQQGKPAPAMAPEPTAEDRQPDRVDIGKIDLSAPLKDASVRLIRGCLERLCESRDNAADVRAVAVAARDLINRQRRAGHLPSREALLLLIEISEAGI
ncbi:hypothetical protein OJF2_65220 [Aquisphaera giovannonii]|uniref:Uncharacterized protein n=1 Tax=Aquisphaera giovannonii TaxID=406548 RepID=A0A5B9WBN9_9BACT|nr:hypothetical protein [Aquisphaera giovannonii]QEH37927.1 hypothetical protein OJF2_65220 [Aquisphaera giovannonii]